MNKNREYISPVELADKLGRHPQTVYRWLRQGRVPGAFHDNGYNWRISLFEVERRLIGGKLLLK